MGYKVYASLQTSWREVLIVNITEAHIFVSYSRIDEALVTPIVQVMRAIGAGVFQDIDSVPYGDRWRPCIEDSIDRATVVLVFWCAHARDSQEVRNECKRAIGASKRVVPTLLDDTPLEESLAEYQAIDLRTLAAAHAGVGIGEANLFPGESERWARRHIDAKENDHLRTVGSLISTKIALSLLSSIWARSISVTTHEYEGGHEC